MESRDWASLLQICITLLILMAALYCFCYFGDRVTQRFDDISDAIYLMAWHLIPLSTQRHLPMIISQAQKKVYVRGYAEIHSTRQIFMQVISGHLKLLITLNSFKCQFNANWFWFQIIKRKFFFVLLLRKFWRTIGHQKYVDKAFKWSILLFHHSLIIFLNLNYCTVLRKMLKCKSKLNTSLEK